MVSAALASCSTAAATRYPAASTPRSRPPAPENNEIATGPSVMAARMAGPDDKTLPTHRGSSVTTPWGTLLGQELVELVPDGPAHTEVIRPPELVELGLCLELAPALTEIVEAQHSADVLTGGGRPLAAPDHPRGRRCPGSACRYPECQGAGRKRQTA